MSEVNNPLLIDPNNTGLYARLYLYSPRIYGTQVLRPFTYGFTEQNADFLLGKGDTLNDAISRKDVLNTPEVASIIRPDAIGTSIDMGGFSNLWTFVLVLHIPNNYHSGILASAGSKLLVFKGHCGDEPIDQSSIWMSTPIINKRCPLFVHSREILRDNPTNINAFGMRDTVDVCSVTDVIDGCLNQSSNNRELFLMTPSEVLTNFSMDGVSCASTAGLCTIANDRKSVQADLKDPGLHLKQILQGIDASREEAESQEYAPHGIDSFSGALSPVADVSQFKTNVASQLSMMNGPSEIETGIEMKSGVFIEDIERAYPNLVIIPQQISTTAQLDILPQDYQSKRTVYSSMASSAIQAIAAGCGLSSISFQFQSYDPARRDELIKSSFQVVPNMTYLSCPPSNQEMYNFNLQGAVTMFRKKLESDLVPFIKYICGEFFMQATYVSNGETTVNLQFLDDTATTNGGDAWFETPSRLSSLSSTTVGNKDNFDNNGHSLNAFVMHIQGQTGKNAMGITAFDRPEVHFGDNAPAVNPLVDALPNL